MRRSFHLLALPLAMGCKKPVPASYELKVAFSSHKRRRLHLQLDHSRQKFDESRFGSHETSELGIGL